MKLFKFNRIGLCKNPNVPINEGTPLRFGYIKIETAEFKPGKWCTGLHYHVTTWGYGFGCFKTKTRKFFNSEKEAVWNMLQQTIDECISMLEINKGTGDEDFNPKMVRKYIRRIKELQKNFNYREPSLFDFD